MSDVVQRLHAEIERMRAENRTFRDRYVTRTAYDAVMDECKRLRAALRSARDLHAICTPPRERQMLPVQTKRTPTHGRVSLLINNLRSILKAEWQERLALTGHYKSTTYATHLHS